MLLNHHKGPEVQRFQKKYGTCTVHWKFFARMYFWSSNPIRFHSQKTRGQLLSCLDINVALLDTELSPNAVDSSTPDSTGEVELCKSPAWQSQEGAKRPVPVILVSTYHLQPNVTSEPRLTGGKAPNFRGILYPAWPFNGKLITF